MASTPAQATSNIEDIRIGQRVLADNPELDDVPRGTAVDPTTWKLLRLHAEERWADGTVDTIEIETLQPPTWVARCGVEVGVSVPIPLDLVEMGLPEDLLAEVTAIEPCPPIQPGAGRVVLTTVNHLNPCILALTVENEDGQRETINPTGFHKFYSETRGGWVSAEHLMTGEMLGAIESSLQVVSLVRRPGVERVYNMTVEGDHVYHVSALGVVAHNNGCAQPPLAAQNRAANLAKGISANQLGPSGKPKRHFVRHASKQRAKNAARQAGKGAPVNHPNPAVGSPHYHPVGPGGKKMPHSVHHVYPPKQA